MKGKRIFKNTDKAEIRKLIRDLRGSSREDQKVIRATLREVYLFYILDFTASKKGFTLGNFDLLLKSGQIRFL